MVVDNEYSDYDSIDSGFSDGYLPDGGGFIHPFENDDDNDGQDTGQSDGDTDPIANAYNGGHSTHGEFSIEWESTDGATDTERIIKRRSSRASVGRPIAGLSDKRDDITGTVGRKRSGRRAGTSDVSATTSGRTTASRASAAAGLELSQKDLDRLQEVVDKQKTGLEQQLPTSKKFTEALFTCYVKDVRHTPDGEMEIKIRIPGQDVFEGIKLAFAYQEVLSCQMTRRQIR